MGLQRVGHDLETEPQQACVLRLRQKFIPLILLTSLGGWYYNPHFTDEVGLSRSLIHMNHTGAKPELENL